MASKVKVWVSWRKRRKRFEVGFRWEKILYQFYSWDVPSIGEHYDFTKKNEHKAWEFKQYIEGLAIPDQRTGVCRFDPTKLSKQRKSKYALRRYGKTWIEDYNKKAGTGDCSDAYVALLSGYLESHLYPRIGDMSLFEIDGITIREIYQGLHDGNRSKKHIQNIMDCLRMILKSACEDMQGLEMPKFPKYREKQRVKINKFLLPEDQDLVISYVAPFHKAMAMVCLYYGLRSQEIINLKRIDLIKIGGPHGQYPALSVKTLKGGPERVIPIDQATYNEIQAIRPISLTHLITFKGQPYYRKTIGKILRRALDKAGFKDYRPYDASRHSRASQIAMKGGSAFEIQDQLGHADIRTSQVYTHIKTSDKWIRSGQQLVNTSNDPKNQDIEASNE